MLLQILAWSYASQRSGECCESDRSEVDYSYSFKACDPDSLLLGKHMRRLFP